MTIAGRLFAVLLALMVAVPVFAQEQRTAGRSYTQPELDQMLAPVALYPDPLLAQVLMAATYPHEVAEAARWSRANSGLQGDDAVRAVQNEDWDPSVKSLVAFPQILARMAEHPAWTQSLGDAFLAQEPHVMDTVQQLRRRAQAAGNLQSNEQMQVQVQVQGQTIVVQPASPQYIYLPYYDPLVVYGPWWWPAYQPMYWPPRSGPSGIRISIGFFFGNFDWLHRHVRVVHPTAYYYRPAVVPNRTVVVTPQRWQHEPQRRVAIAEQRQLHARQQVQAQPQFQRPERRVEQRVERLSTVQAQPAARAQVQVQSQPQIQPSVQVRDERRAQRREEHEPARFERREVRQAQGVPAAPIRAMPQLQAQPQLRMPAAAAPQQPRAERHEHRQEPRNERGPRGRERS